ncbi:MFS transporter [Streptomyces syringium]|uniref:MFS transporter n=1 Tax=Streptomyces syringium TaxID=76729 RepID=UPI003AAF15D8
MRTLQAVRGFPLALRLLLLNQFGVDVGFYLLIPFLAEYLGQGLGMSAALVGLVLGTRNLSQEGLFLLGGSAADRIGPRAVIICGCALRTVGFALFAVGDSLPLLLGASALSGLAGAMFYPAMRAYVALEAGERKAEAFSLLTVSSTAASLVGLLLGSLLVTIDFRLCALSAAVVFAILTGAQVFLLPTYRVPSNRGTVLADWRAVFGDRRFVVFAFAVTGMFAMENQLYLLLPEGARQASGWQGAASVLLATGAVASMLFQLRITRLLARRGGGARWVGAGLAVIGLGFTPPLLICGAGPPHGFAESASRIVVMVTGSLLLYLGLMIAQPAVMDLIPRFGLERLTGTYYGLFYVFSGLVATGGNAAVGWAMDVAGATGHAWLPWMCCLCYGMVSATAALWLYRARALPCRPVPAPTALPVGAAESAVPGAAVGDGVGPSAASRLRGPARPFDDTADQSPR